MVGNPLEGDLKKAKDDLQDLYRRRDNLNKNRSWYQNTDPSALASAIQSLEAKQKESEDSRQGVIDQINGIQEEIGRLPIKSMFNPANWFNSEQRGLRRQRKALRQTENEFRQQLRGIDKRLGSIGEEIRSNSDELQRYHDYEKDEKELPTKIPEKEKEVNRIKKRKGQIDKAQEPLLIQIKEYEGKLKDIERKKHKAQKYESELDRARNSYERAKIHAACEAELGDGSPTRLIRKWDTEINKHRRDKQKTDERIRSLTQAIYSRDIWEVVIDGNNLCYADQQFIGLALLDALISVLLQDYDVTIIFDPGICHQLKLNEQAIKEKYAPATVRVTAIGHKADETIVKYASDDKHVYVLSGDRFGDFREYPVVRERRLIQPEIIKNKLIIHDLDVIRGFRS